MNALSRMLGVRDPEARSISFQDVWGRGLDLASNVSSAGINVTDDNALALSAVYGSCRILSEGVSKLEVETFTGPNPGAERAVVPDWVTRPDTRAEHLGFGELLDRVMMSLLLRGTAYIATQRDPGTNNITTMRVLDPDNVEATLVPGRGVLFKVNRSQTLLTENDISMVIGLSKPGSITGMSPIDHARETIGLGLAAQQFGAAFFANGAQTSGLIEVEGSLSQEGADMLRRSWNNAHQGSGKAHKVAVITEGAKYKPITVTPEQAQFLDTRRFQVPDVARIFGVPPHLLQDASGSTSWGSGLAEQSTNYVVHSLRPWTSRIDAWLTRLRRSEAAGVGSMTTLRLSIDHLTRGAFPARVDAYHKGIEAGIFTPDEVRGWEKLPPGGQNSQEQT